MNPGPHDRPIPLYPHPPLAVPTHQAHMDPPSDEQSDFPPIRTRRQSTPVAAESDPPSPPRPDPSLHPPSQSVQRPPGYKSNKGTTQRFHSGRLSQKSPSQSHPSRRSNPGLGHKNLLNTFDTKTKNIPKSSSKKLKRSSEVIVIPDSSSDVDRPLKRTCLDQDDMVWLRAEIGDIKKSIGTRRIADHLREDVDIKLEELIHDVRQLS